MATYQRSFAFLLVAFVLSGCSGGNKGMDAGATHDPVAGTTPVPATAPGVTAEPVASASPESADIMLPAHIFPECDNPDASCEVVGPLRLAVSGQELQVIGVNHMGKNDGVMGQAIAVFEKDESLRWSSPMELVAGYGLISLDFDQAGGGHVFVSSAITNHTLAVQVLDLSVTPPRTFGFGGDEPPHRVNGISEPRNGVRDLYAERYNWTQVGEVDGPSHDLYRWDADLDAYVYGGCIDIGFAQSPAAAQAQRIPAGEPPCEAPAGPPTP